MTDQEVLERVVEIAVGLANLVPLEATKLQAMLAEKIRDIEKRVLLEQKAKIDEFVFWVGASEDFAEGGIARNGYLEWKQKFGLLD